MAHKTRHHYRRLEAPMNHHFWLLQRNIVYCTYTWKPSDGYYRVIYLPLHVLERACLSPRDRYRPTEYSLLNASRRFAGRRSLPRLIISDHATTFHLSAAFNACSSHRPFSQHWLRKDYIGSLFIRGNRGWWEWLVGVMKTTFKKVIEKASINL